MSARLAPARLARNRSRAITCAARGLVALLGAAPALAHAGWFFSGCSTNAGIGLDVQTVGQIVNWMVSPVQNADAKIASLGMELAGNFTSIAYVIAGLIASTWLMWSVLREFADGNGNYAAIVVDAVAPMALTSASLGMYPKIASGIAAAFINAVPSATSGVSAGLTSFANSMLGGFANAVNAVIQTTNCFSMFTLGKAYLTGSMGPVLHAYMMVILMFIALILAVIAIAEIIGVMLLGSIFSGVALAVGPLFMATGLSTWTRHLMRGWIEFLGGAFLYKGLVSLVLTLVAPVVTAFTTANQATMTATTGLTLGAALSLMAFLWVLRHAMIQIPHMAKALVGGHAQSVSVVGDAAAYAKKMYKLYSFIS